MGTRAVTFGTVRLIFRRVNVIFLAHTQSEKVEQAWTTSGGGPGLKSGPRTRVSAIFFFFDFNVLYNSRKIMLILCWSLSAGDFSKEFLCEGLGNRCKNARWLNTLRVPFLVQGCLLEINVETNRPYLCRVNDAGRTLDLRPACI